MVPFLFLLGLGHFFLEWIPFLSQTIVFSLPNFMIRLKNVVFAIPEFCFLMSSIQFLLISWYNGLSSWQELQLNNHSLSRNSARKFLLNVEPPLNRLHMLFHSIDLSLACGWKRINLTLMLLVFSIFQYHSCSVETWHSNLCPQSLLRLVVSLLLSPDYY